MESKRKDSGDSLPGSLERALDFLPYPFLLSKIRGGVRRNLFVNNRFLDEIGYQCEEISTMSAWWDKAYPDPDYKKSISEAWGQLAQKAEEDGSAEIIMTARITTKHKGPRWYEVKSSITPEAHLVAFVNVNEGVRREERLKARLETKNLALSVLSHDLRSPLSSLFSLSELALKGNVAQEEFRDVVSKVNKKTSEVLGLLDLTLLWTRANFGAIQISRSEVKVKEILNDVLALYAGPLAEKAVDVSVSKDLDTMVVSTDAQIFTILVRNLLSNAIKFTPSGGSIKIFMNDDGKSVTILDSGPGIGEDVLRRLAGHEITVDRRMLRGEGAGLGLSLCVELARHIDAVILIQNGEKAGAQVSIKFNS